MGICWYCYWGWPKVVFDIYDRALSDLDNNMSPLHFGPAHIVWEDENFHLAEWCLEHFDKYINDYSHEHLVIVRRSLEELTAISMKDRCIEPDDYDDEHPEKFPPPNNIEMVRR